MSTPVVDMLPATMMVGNHVGYYLVVGAVLLVAYLLQPPKYKEVDAPFYKAPKMQWMFNAEKLVRDSYSKFRDQVYKIKATEGTRVLIPARLIAELKGLPEDILSATEAVNEAMLIKYTQFSLGHHGDLMSLVIRSKLTQHLTRLVPQMREELEHLLGQEFPQCEDWTPFKFQPFALRCVGRLSGRAFVGPELNRTEEWLDTSTNYAIHVFTAVIKLQFFPTFMRPLAQHLISELGQSRNDIAKAEAMLAPIVEERLRYDDCPNYEKPDDFIQWLLDVLPEDQKRDYRLQAHLQLVLSAASIHTTSNLLTDSVYYLATYPEYQEILRREAYQVLVEERGWERKESMAKLKKMDSFVKESQRLTGNITSFIRKVVKPIELSDGTHLPPGTNLLTPLAGISHDERYFPDPDAFDGLRFYNLRQKSDEDSNRWQFTSISDTNVNFGLGKHSCPGRFFAGNEIKVILAYFVLNYDIKLKEGEGRPEPMMFMMSKSPNTTAEILFRKRSSWS